MSFMIPIRIGRIILPNLLWSPHVLSTIWSKPGSLDRTGTTSSLASQSTSLHSRLTRPTEPLEFVPSCGAILASPLNPLTTVPPSPSKPQPLPLRYSVMSTPESEYSLLTPIGKILLSPSLHHLDRYTNRSGPCLNCSTTLI